MSWSLSDIGNHVEKISSWNPSQSLISESFSYIDLSSIDKDKKVISLKDVPIINPVEAPSRARQIVNANDVLVSTVRPNLNGVAVVSDELEGATASTGYCVLRADNSTLYFRYLYHWVKTNSFIEDMMKKATGANYPAISDKIIKESKIPLPPLAEQKRIAAILDKADSLRRKNQQAIQLADQFLSAVFLDMFGDPVTNPRGWDEVELKEIADIRSGVTKGKKIDLSIAVTLPYMRVANVQDGYLDLSSIQNITVSSNDAKKCQLEKGEILLTEGGDPDKLGRGYIWNNEIENCIHQNHIFSVRINDKNKIRPEFLSAVIASQRGKRYFLKVGKQTTGIATINKSVLSEFNPFIPPIEIQDEFIASVNKANRIKQLFSKGEFNLFNSLSQKAFAGEL